jgi:energy-coupling factor transporter transmembrane protein EcfT
LTVIMIAISRISFSVILKGIKPIVFILIFTSLINIFMTVGEGEPLIKFWIIKIYTEGFIRAFFMAYRVTLLIVSTSMLLTMQASIYSQVHVLSTGVNSELTYPYISAFAFPC